MISVSHAASLFFVHFCWIGDFEVRIWRTAPLFIFACGLLAPMAMVWPGEVRASQEAGPPDPRGCTGPDYNSATKLLEKDLPKNARDKAFTAITALDAEDPEFVKKIECLKDILARARQKMLDAECKHTKYLENKAASGASVTYQSVRAGYKAILENKEYANATRNCAVEGLSRVAEADKQMLVDEKCAATKTDLSVATADGPVTYNSVRAAYEAILENKEYKKVNRGCAVEGLRKVAKDDKQTQVETACRAAQKLQSFTTVDGPLTYEDVRTKYKAILENDSYADANKSCAYIGLTKVVELEAQQEGDIAKRYYAEGNVDEAIKHYKTAIDLLPSNVEWITILSALREDHIKQQLTRLGELGEDAKVKEVFTTALKSNPDLALPSEARSAFGIQLPLWSELLGHKAEVLLPEATVLKTSTRGTLHPQWVWLKSYLASITLAELILLAALIVIVWRKFIWAQPTLLIDKFRRLNTKDGDDEDFVTRMRAQLMGMTKGHGSDRFITFIHGPVKQVNLGSIPASVSKTLGPNLKIIYTIYQFLFARTVLSVSGIVKNESYVEVQMRRSGRIIAETLIGYEDYVPFIEDKDECDAIKAENLLPQLVGIWVAYQSMRHPSTIVPRMISWLLSLVNRKPEILGTSDWHSYSLFHISGRCPAGGDLAQQALERALERDPNFWAARVNLATLMHIRSDSRPILLRAYELLNAGRDQSRLRIWKLDLTYFVNLYRSTAVWLRMTILGDPTGFAHLFRSSAVLLDLSCDLEDKDTSNSNRRVDEALKKAKTLKSRLWWAENFRFFSRSDFKAYIIWRKPIAECLRIGLAVKAETITKAMDLTTQAAELDDVEKALSSRFDAHSLYNLACTFAIFAETASKRLRLETGPRSQGDIETNESNDLEEAHTERSIKSDDHGPIIRCWAEKALLHLENAYKMADRVPASRAAIKIKKLSEVIKARAKYDCAFAFFRKNHNELFLDSDGEKRLKILLNVEDNGESSPPQ